MERIEAKLDRPVEGCWLWTGATAGGYGKVGLGDRGRFGYVHVLMWQQANGPVPEGLELDHLCRNRACARPDHLEPVTHKENVRRGDSRWGTREACKAGHPWTEASTMIDAGRGTRRCRICDQERHQRYRAAKSH